MNFFEIATIVFAISVAQFAPASANQITSTENQNAYRLTGESKRCLRNTDINWFQVVDGSMIMFGTDEGVYFNKLLNGCTLPNDREIKIEFHSRQGHRYCRNDAFTATETTGQRRYYRCVLTNFEKAIEVSTNEDGTEEDSQQQHLND